MSFSRFATAYLVCLLSLLGCATSELEKKVELNYQAQLYQEFPTPYNVKNLERIGDNWATFEWRDKKFLMYSNRHSELSTGGYTIAITQIVEEKK